MPWGMDWLWGLPFLMLTIVTHVGAILLAAEIGGSRVKREDRNEARFIILVALGALAATALLALDAAAWAELYIWLDAVPDQRSAMLYSLGAITSYGHATIYLQSRWQLLGAIEAVNGLILFGLTTAFLFAFIAQLWPLRKA